jgi:hypothetical protein
MIVQIVMTGEHQDFFVMQYVSLPWSGWAANGVAPAAPFLSDAVLSAVSAVICASCDPRQKSIIVYIAYAAILLPSTGG